MKHILKPVKLSEIETMIILFRCKEKLEKYRNVDKIYTQMPCYCVFETQVMNLIGGYNTSLYLCCNECYNSSGKTIVKNIFRAQNEACIHNVCELIEKYGWKTQVDSMNTLLGLGVNMKEMKANANELNMLKYAKN